MTADAELVAALEDATASLNTIRLLSGKDECLHDVWDVRAYAESRFRVACTALARYRERVASAVDASEQVERIIDEGREPTPAMRELFAPKVVDDGTITVKIDAWNKLLDAVIQAPAGGVEAGREPCCSRARAIREGGGPQTAEVAGEAEAGREAVCRCGDVCGPGSKEFLCVDCAMVERMDEVRAAEQATAEACAAAVDALMAEHSRAPDHADDDEVAAIALELKGMAMAMDRIRTGAWKEFVGTNGGDDVPSR